MRKHRSSAPHVWWNCWRLSPLQSPLHFIFQVSWWTITKRVTHLSILKCTHIMTLYHTVTHRTLNEEDHAHQHFVDNRWAYTNLSSNSNIVVILHFDHSRPKLGNILFHLAFVMLAGGKVLELINANFSSRFSVFYLWSTFDEAIWRWSKLDFIVIVLLLTRQGQISFKALTLTRGLSCLKMNIDELKY